MNREPYLKEGGGLDDVVKKSKGKRTHLNIRQKTFIVLGDLATSSMLDNRINCRLKEMSLKWHTDHTSCTWVLCQTFTESDLCICTDGSHMQNGPRDF